jgi:hypothetical protein
VSSDPPKSGTDDGVGTLAGDNDAAPARQSEHESGGLATEIGTDLEGSAQSATDPVNITTNVDSCTVNSHNKVSPAEEASPPPATADCPASGHHQVDSPLGNNHAAFDLEWSSAVVDNNSADPVIYAAAIVDSHGNQKVLHIADFANSKSSLVQAIVDEISCYCRLGNHVYNCFFKHPRAWRPCGRGR